MKRLFCAFAVVVTIALCASSISAGEDSEERNRYGVGISLFEEFLSFAGSTHVTDLTGGVNVYFPVRVGGSFRIEPEIGFVYTSFNYEYGGETYDNWERVIRVGFGMGPIIQKGKLDLYYGLRFGLAFAALKDYARTIYSPEGTDVEVSKTDWYIGPALGSEYFVSPHFSVGGEVRLEFASYGEWDDSSSMTDLYVLQNRNLFFIRWYF